MSGGASPRRVSAPLGASWRTRPCSSSTYGPSSAPRFALAGIGYGAAVSFGGLSWAARERHERVTRVGALYALALLFPLPIFLFASPWAAVAGMTIAHGFQYLLLTGLVALGTPGHDRAPARRRGSPRWQWPAACCWA